MEDALSELNRVNLKFEIENEIRAASQKMEALELFDKASERGSKYYAAFQDGFGAALDLIAKYDITGTEPIDHKYNKFTKFFDTDDL